MTQYLTTNPIIPPLEWKRCIREITIDYPELLNMDDSEDNKLWPWYGDLISDPNKDEKDAPHVRYKTNFYRKYINIIGEFNFELFNFRNFLEK